MTPEQIHELLDNATPGPWEARATYANGTPRQDTSRQMRAGDQYLGIMHAPDAYLAAAAPDLAEIVAGMRQVYDYEVTLGDGVWHQMGHEFDSLESAQEWVADRRRVSQARIITRYVTGWEVVQDGRT